MWGTSGSGLSCPLQSPLSCSHNNSWLETFPCSPCSGRTSQSQSALSSCKKWPDWERGDGNLQCIPKLGYLDMGLGS